MLHALLRRHPRLAAALPILVLIALGHGWSVDQGLFMDDHVHYQSLRDGDWSVRSAINASNLGVLGDVLDVWNRKEKGLYFFRPIAFWTMKAEYTLARFDPAYMHLFSLAWHFLAAMLVAELARFCLGSHGLAALAGMLFSVHPALSATTYWIACQTEIMVTVWLLAAFLSYARFSRWPSPLFGISRQWNCSEQTPRCDWRWFVAAAFFFILALGCRETALLFAPLIFLADLIIRPRKLRWGATALMGAISLAYLAIRFAAMRGFPLPAPPYLMLPSQPGFLGYVVEKFMLYSLGLFGYFPISPVGALDYFRQSVWRFQIPFAGVVVGWALLGWMLPRRRGLAIPFLWLFLTMLPMLPIGTSPHHLYLPCVAMILILVTALAIGAGSFRQRPGVAAASRLVGIGVVIGLHLIGFTFGAWGNGWLYRGACAIEDAAVRQVASTPRPIAPGDHLFFINLPLNAWYVVPAYENQTGLRNLRGHVLTFCPSLLMVEQPTRLLHIDEHTLRVETTGKKFFTGAAGTLLLEVLDLHRDFARVKTIDANLYTVELDHGTDGLWAMTFRFHRPLTDPSFHFFYGSRQQLAYPIEFDGPTGSAVAAGSENAP